MDEQRKPRITPAIEREGGNGLSAVLWLFDRNHRVLLVRRSADGREEGAHWDLPWTGTGDEAVSREAAGGAVGLGAEAVGEPVMVGRVALPAETGGGDGKTATGGLGSGAGETPAVPGLGSGVAMIPARRDPPAGETPAVPGEAEGVRVFFAEVERDEALAAAVDVASGAGVLRVSVEALERTVAADLAAFSDRVRGFLPAIRPYLIRLPYLGMRESDYIYRFRTEKQRNRDIYRSDEISGKLYQSRLCEAIKTVKRTSERSAEGPAALDFGPVSYVLPSHFGFCLGVQNAIERAYECLAENPGRRVYMLSELIHNPFVNEDICRRGLEYLQTDTGEVRINPETGRPFWDEIGPDDVVVIPAFGSTNEDKVRLIEKGITINRYDATCMLVEKVWKAARRFGAEGYTVLIHGKSEHEETKATFSNSAAVTPSLILRNMEEARLLGEIILSDDPAFRQERFRAFAGKHTPGFSPESDLERIAVVNQTTLLRNETLKIIRYLEDVFTQKYGPGRIREHLHPGSKGDTLCYATQVNQNALDRALAGELDAAVVVGGKNSSNTYQLYRMCAEKLGTSAFYIQSEENLLSRARIRHYTFPAAPGGDGRIEERAFLPDRQPVRILVTGGASCPDGLIQQVISRINSFFPADSLKPIDEVLNHLEGLSP